MKNDKLADDQSKIMMKTGLIRNNLRMAKNLASPKYYKSGLLSITQLKGPKKSITSPIKQLKQHKLNYLRTKRRKTTNNEADNQLKLDPVKGIELLICL